MNPRVKSVIPNEDYTLIVTFENGEIRQFDVKPYLDKGIFTELRNMDYFKQVSVFLGTVSWHDRQDFCPDTVYEKSIPVQQ